MDIERTVILEKKNIDHQLSAVKSSLITEDFGNEDECFYDIDPGVYDYLIKCIGHCPTEPNQELK